MNRQKGTGMVEILIASAIIAVVVVSIIGVYNSLAGISLQNTEQIQSSLLLEEGVEAVRVMRDNSWSYIGSSTVGIPYYLRWQGGTWVPTTTPQRVDVFTRTITFTNVNRDGNFNIVSSGGTPDSGTRKATVSVQWSTDSAGTTTKSIEMYIFRTFNN